MGGGAAPDSAASKIQRLIFLPVIMENNPAEKHASRAGGGGVGSGGHFCPHSDPMQAMKTDLNVGGGGQ